MKKLILLLPLFLLLQSCENKNGILNNKNSKTYEIRFNSLEYIPNSLFVYVDIYISEYNDLDEWVNSVSWSYVDNGSLKQFRANKRTAKITVRISIKEVYYYKGDSFDIELENRYIAYPIYLDEKNKIIEIGENTPLSSDNPISTK